MHQPSLVFPRGEVTMDIGERQSPDGERGGGEGVRTRDHLANTRTFLTWLRTGLALTGIGYVVDKYSLVANVVHRRPVTTTPTDDRVVALLVASVGVLLTVGSGIRFLMARRRIDRAGVRASSLISSLIDAGLVLGVSLIGVVVLVYLLRLGA